MLRETSAEGHRHRHSSVDGRVWEEPVHGPSRPLSHNQGIEECRPQMSLFALVHGGAHGGWCWEMVVPELERRGHRVVAPDLPFEEPDAGAAEWARTVISAVDEAVSSDDADVVVVGHSLAGLAVPVVASWRPVRRMVFLAAQVPVPGQRYVDYLATQPDAVIFDGTPRPDD